MKNIYKRVEGPMTWSSSTNVTEGHRTHFIGVQRVEGPQNRVNSNQCDGRTRDTPVRIDTISTYIESVMYA